MHILPQKHNNKWLIIILVAIFFIIILSLPTFYLLWENKYENRVYPGVFLGQNGLGGKTREEVKLLLNNRIDKLKENGQKIIFHKQEATLFPLISAFDADIAYELISFNTEKTIDNILSFGRTGTFRQNLIQKWQGQKKGFVFEVEATFNQEKIQEFIADNFSTYSRPAIDAKLIYNEATYSQPAYFSVEEEKYGELIEYQKGFEALEKQISQLDYSPIELSATVNYPKILKRDCLNIDSKANAILSKAPLTLKYEDSTWLISKRQLRDWLTLKSSLDPEAQDKHFVGLDFEQVEKYLLDTVSPKINIEPVDAKFEIKDGRVLEFQLSQDGKKIDILKSFAQIEKKLLSSSEEENIELVVVEKKSELKSNDVNDMGIKEIIGTGHSNFAGSPSNRRHNIAVGAAAVNGSLIKPGEEFSLLATLGEINKETGYLPELVIKDNKTVPEYGGGLCQIGTTVFRATVASGMPVTQRRNHSYRVSYYEPAGTDATIYDPWPDYRWMNDSPYSILIQSRIEGDDIYFDFWSTNDGRTATATYPTIHNITKPAPTKIIETLDLELGVKKCTEHAHNGADAFFDYTITYSKNNPPEDIMEKQIAGEVINDEDYIKEKRFYSHYVPWREVCLVGVTELSTSTPELLPAID